MVCHIVSCNVIRMQQPIGRMNGTEVRLTPISVCLEYLRSDCGISTCPMDSIPRPPVDPGAVDGAEALGPLFPHPTTIANCNPLPKIDPPPRSQKEEPYKKVHIRVNKFQSDVRSPEGGRMLTKNVKFLNCEKSPSKTNLELTWRRLFIVLRRIGGEHAAPSEWVQHACACACACLCSVCS